MLRRPALRALDVTDHGEIPDSLPPNNKVNLALLARGCACWGMFVNEHLIFSNEGVFFFSVSCWLGKHTRVHIMSDCSVRTVAFF